MREFSVTGPVATRLTASAPCWRLVDAVARAGWGVLRDEPQSSRTTLAVLAGLADSRTGATVTTHGQLSDRTGLSHSTIRRALTNLHRLGLVDYTPGFWRGHAGHPSKVHVLKRALWSLIDPARWAKHLRELGRYAAQLTRTARLNNPRRYLLKRIPAGTAPPAPGRVKIGGQNDIPPPLRGVGAAPTPPPAATAAARGADLCRQQIRSTRSAGPPIPRRR